MSYRDLWKERVKQLVRCSIIWGVIMILVYAEVSMDLQLFVGGWLGLVWLTGSLLTYIREKGEWIWTMLCDAFTMSFVGVSYIGIFIFFWWLGFKILVALGAILAVGIYYVAFYPIQSIVLFIKSRYETV